MTEDLNASLTPDLNGQPCCVAMCFQVADVVGLVIVRLPAGAGVAPLDQDQSLELPLCVEHAHLLRLGVESFDLQT